MPDRDLSQTAVAGNKRGYDRLCVETDGSSDNRHSVGVKRRKPLLPDVGDDTRTAEASAGPLVETDAQSHTDASDANDTMKASDIPSPIARLRSEAVFYPKFDNESRGNKIIRKEMMELVAAGEGYLEVTLKHSGSLILWSGGQRYYSKNATDNVFCYVAEILLRQHFVRAWNYANDADTARTVDNPRSLDDADTASAHNGRDGTERHYQRCSDYLQRHRITLAFEVVTAVLGDHGDIPNRDFLILTAVADRNAERFYSTNEVIHFAQKFRLPHNDTWIVAQPESAQALFELYATTQETGTATVMVDALSHKNISQVHIASMYPHSVFQGEILEGIIIRYVPYQNKADTAKVHSMLAELANTADRYLQAIPPHLAPCYQTITNSNKGSRSSKNDAIEKSAILTADVRRMFRETQREVDGRSPGFEKALRSVLQSGDGTSGRRTIRKLGSKQVNFTALVKHLATGDASKTDAETRRIANLVRMLASMRKSVNYSIVYETTGSAVAKNANDSPDTTARWLCTIHVLYDQTFYKYQREKTPDCMQLYRGFCIEFQGAGEASRDDARISSASNARLDGTAQDDGTSNILMLKMKLLPYMVRTFICRNNLKLVSQKGEGPDAFVNAARRLMGRWGISKPSQDRWLPFFREWSYYALQQISSNKGNKTKKLANNAKGKRITDTNCDQNGSSVQLPALSSGTYLRHLEHFTEQYDAGSSFAPAMKKTFSGMVFVVAVDEEQAKRGAEVLSRTIEGSQVLSSQAVIDSDVRTGAICFVSVAGNSKRVKKLLRDIKDYVVVVLVGCDRDTVSRLVTEKNERSKIGGILPYWKNFTHVELPLVAGKDQKLSDKQADTFSSVATKEVLKAISDNARKAPVVQDATGSTIAGDFKPGLSVFVPGITGCGKSTILRPDTVAMLKERLEAAKEERSVQILVGDDLGKRFWKVMETTSKKAGPAILIVDKNIPPSAWDNIGQQCVHSNGFPVPVLPDSAALNTTVLEGARNPNGSFRHGVSHIYPFSMHYLALCMLRVLQRKPATHPGKLDSGLSHACTVVAMFYSFYRGISADELLEALSMKLEGAGAANALEPIVLPFFNKANLPPLPEDLEQVLTEAVQLQFGFDLSRKRAKEKDSVIQEMESRLRAALTKHEQFLVSLAADEPQTRDAFLEQCCDRVKAVSDMGSDVLATPKARTTIAVSTSVLNKIKLVSIDVDRSSVYRILKERSDGDLQNFFRVSLDSSPSAETFGQVLERDQRFIPNTHITMAHCSRCSPSKMVSTFERSVGATVPLRVMGLLWNSRVAAFEMAVAAAARDGRDVPPCQNEFVHMTVWTAKGVSAVEANSLKTLSEKKEAEHVVFRDVVAVDGTLTFWGKNNKPLDAKKLGLAK